MTTKSAATQLHAIANSYWRDAGAMKRDPEHFTSYDCVAYSTIAKELRKVAALLDEEAKSSPSDGRSTRAQWLEVKATLAKVAAIVADPNAAPVVDRIRGVLEPTPKGTKP